MLDDGGLVITSLQAFCLNFLWFESKTKNVHRHEKGSVKNLDVVTESLDKCFNIFPFNIWSRDISESQC